MFCLEEPGKEKECVSETQKKLKRNPFLQKYFVKGTMIGAVKG